MKNVIFKLLPDTGGVQLDNLNEYSHGEIAAVAAYCIIVLAQANKCECEAITDDLLKVINSANMQEAHHKQD